MSGQPIEISPNPKNPLVQIWITVFFSFTHFCIYRSKWWLQIKMFTHLLPTHVLPPHGSTPFNSLLQFEQLTVNVMQYSKNMSAGLWCKVCRHIFINRIWTQVCFFSDTNFSLIQFWCRHHCDVIKVGLCVSCPCLSTLQILSPQSVEQMTFPPHVFIASQ